MKSPEEIKKGLEYVAETNVTRKIDLIRAGIVYQFTEDLAADALAYIQQLEAKLAEYETAIADGRMVMLPCKPGGDLYWISDLDHDDKSCDPYVRCQARGIEAVVVRGKDDFAIVADGEITEINTQWSFITEEAAQKAISDGSWEDDE